MIVSLLSMMSLCEKSSEYRRLYLFSSAVATMTESHHERLYFFSSLYELDKVFRLISTTGKLSIISLKYVCIILTFILSLIITCENSPIVWVLRMSLPPFKAFERTFFAFSCFSRSLWIYACTSMLVSINILSIIQILSLPWIVFQHDRLRVHQRVFFETPPRLLFWLFFRCELGQIFMNLRYKLFRQCLYLSDNALYCDGFFSFTHNQSPLYNSYWNHIFERLFFVKEKMTKTTNTEKRNQEYDVNLIFRKGLRV